MGENLLHKIFEYKFPKDLLDCDAKTLFGIEIKSLFEKMCRFIFFLSHLGHLKFFVEGGGGIYFYNMLYRLLHSTGEFSCSYGCFSLMRILCERVDYFRSTIMTISHSFSTSSLPISSWRRERSFGRLLSVVLMLSALIPIRWYFTY